MVSKIVIVIFLLVLSLELQLAKSQTWIRAGYYWYAQKEFPISDINSTLFTHLICGFAQLNATSYHLSLTPFDEKHLSTFTNTVKQKNPSITTLLSIGGPDANDSTFSSMVSNSSYRKPFIADSIRMARLYGFKGLDLVWLPTAIRSFDMFSLGILFKEWRAAINSEARNSSNPQLILTVAVKYLPNFASGSYPVDSMQQCVDWVHIVAHDYSTPNGRDSTGAHAALYDPTSLVNTDYGISVWTDAGLSAKKMVLCLPYYGYAWMLVNPKENGVGAPATGPALKQGGSMKYKEIKDYIKRYGNGVKVKYSATYVVNYCTIGKVWLGFDDVEVIRTKVSYAKEKGLLGYFVWQVPFDDNWVLSQAAAQGKIINVTDDNSQEGQILRSRQLLTIILTTSSTAVLFLFCSLIYYRRITKFRVNKTGSFSTYTEDSDKKSISALDSIAAAGNLTTVAPNLIVYNLADIEAATDKFSIENLLGKGGYGPVYKGIFPDGQVIAVKKLSKTSTQGFEEFKNEVMLTAKLQHVNLVKLLGFCVDKEEHMLLYEYMPNKSLDLYLFDPSKRSILDWEKRIHIIEGVCQGLLYLHEYSRLTVIHRDLKASNVLLDKEMNPKIADFGLARIFEKEDLEANTGRIVGTYGYAPPEYVKEGIYSTKSDVYSFGVLLLQIISGKKVCVFYGDHKNLSLLEYAYLLWNSGKDMEFIDSSLSGIYSLGKLMRYLQIALLCVQECPDDRPTMLEICSFLQNESTDMKIPKRPAFSRQTNEHDQRRSSLQVDTCSVNDVTVSELVPR